MLFKVSPYLEIKIEMPVSEPRVLVSHTHDFLPLKCMHGLMHGHCQILCQTLNDLYAYGPGMLLLLFTFFFILGRLQRMHVHKRQRL